MGRHVTHCTDERLNSDWLIVSWLVKEVVVVVTVVVVVEVVMAEDWKPLPHTLAQ